MRGSLIVLGIALLVALYQIGAEPEAAPVQAGTAATPATDMEVIVFAAADEFSVDHNLARAVLAQEGGGDPHSTSAVGAAGLMQVMPKTAESIAQDLGVASYDLYDPATNARFGMYYLSQKIARYGVMWGLAAYNWGPSGVDGFLARHPDAVAMDWPAVLSAYGSEIPGETQGYVTNILAVATLDNDTWPAPAGAKSVVTQTMAVASRFDSRDCGSWGFQVGCMHWGTDFVGSAGDPVFAPYDLTIIALGEYGPGPTWGQYVQGTLPDGSVYYSGHLQDRPALEVGQTIPAGTQIGQMNGYAHTHVQLAPPGNTGPCAQDGSCLDFEQYYATH